MNLGGLCFLPATKARQVWVTVLFMVIWREVCPPLKIFIKPKYIPFVNLLIKNIMKLSLETYLQKYLRQNSGQIRQTRILFRHMTCLLYTSPSPRDRTRSRM